MVVDSESAYQAWGVIMACKGVVLELVRVSFLSCECCRPLIYILSVYTYIQSNLTVT